MATTRDFEFSGSLPEAPAPTAGPFDIGGTQAGNGLRDALLTSLLVVYPAFSTVAAIVVALLLKGTGA